MSRWPPVFGWNIFWKFISSDLHPDHTAQWPRFVLSTRCLKALGNPLWFYRHDVWPGNPPETSAKFQIFLGYRNDLMVLRKGHISGSIAANRFSACLDEEERELVLDFDTSVDLSMLIDACPAGNRQRVQWIHDRVSVDYVYSNALPRFRFSKREYYGHLKFCIAFEVLRLWLNGETGGLTDDNISSLKSWEQRKRICRHISDENFIKREHVRKLYNFFSNLRSDTLKQLRDTGEINEQAYQVLSDVLSRFVPEYPEQAKDGSSEINGNKPTASCVQEIGMTKAIGNDDPKSDQPAVGNLILLHPDLIPLAIKIKRKDIPRLRMLGDLAKGSGAPETPFYSLSEHARLLGYRTKGSIPPFFDRNSSIGVLEVKKSSEGYGFAATVTEKGRIAIRIAEGLMLLPRP